MTPSGPPGHGRDQGPDVGLAWGWVAALRDGSSTSWAQWRHSGGTAPATARDLPGAQQLELVRRINLADAGSHARADLVERVITASATGRGLPERTLVGAVPDRSWGLPPLDPAHLRDHDLLGVAATVVAQDLVAADLAARASGRQRSVSAPGVAVARRARHRVLRRRGGRQVVGDPWLAWTVRDELLRTGRPLAPPGDPGRDGRPVVVVGQDLATMLVGAWTARAFDGGAPSWERWLGSGRGGAVPRPVDLERVARRWSEVVGAERVLLAPDPTLLPIALNLPARARRRLAPPYVSADGVDLARRVSAPLGLLVERGERRRILRRVLLPLLRADLVEHPAPGLALPDSRQAWVVRRAQRMRDGLGAARYPVVGDLQALVPDHGGHRPPGVVPDASGVLGLTVRLLLAPQSLTSHPNPKEKTR